jgi:glycosyltransferase involved in cell wall biosynthesis
LVVNVPRVSVILPTYNRARELPRAILSVLDQTFDDLELIVVDDASDDDTEQVVRKLGDPRIRYLRHDHNRGGGAARNTGIEASEAPWVGFQDSDDAWLPAKLETQIAAIDAAPAEVGAVYCSYWRLHAGGRRVLTPPAGVPPRSGRIHLALLRESFIGTPALLARRDALDRVGLFDERLPRFQDWELMIRLSRDFEVRFVDQPLVEARFADGNITAGHNRALVEAESRILDKHLDWFREAGAELLAYRYWHLAHLNLMIGEAPEARRLLDLARRTHPTARLGLLRLLATTPPLYRGVYSAFDRLRPHR